MKIKLACGIAAVAALAFLGGCSAGMQPTGASVDEIKKKEAAMSPDDQIKMIQGSPMTPAQKQAKIAEIKSKAGIK